MNLKLYHVQFLNKSKSAIAIPIFSLHYVTLKSVAAITTNPYKKKPSN